MPQRTGGEIAGLGQPVHDPIEEGQAVLGLGGHPDQLIGYFAGGLVERAGEFGPRTRLPPEGDLASEYGVAYNTLRQAMSVLRDRGLVVTLRGHGNYAARKDQD
jgi:hypothetical protein